MSEQLWTSEQAAEFINTTPGYLRKLRYLQKGPPWIPWGQRGVRYHPAQVKRWLRAQQYGIEPARTLPRKFR